MLHKEVTTSWQDKDKDIENATKTGDDQSKVYYVIVIIFYKTLFIHIEKPVEIGKLGVSIELEEGLRFAHRNQKWSANEVLTSRLIKLVTEVKNLNEISARTAPISDLIFNS